MFIQVYTISGNTLRTFVQSVQLYKHLVQPHFRKMEDKEIIIKIIDIDVQDIRFPTSLKGDGSDAMVYVLLNNSYNDILAAQYIKKYVH